MRSTQTIPSTLNGLLIWANNWKAQMGALGVNFANFGLSAAPAGFDPLLTAYSAALAASGPNNRSKSTTAALKIAKANLLNYVRPIAQQISSFPEGPAAAGVCPRQAKIDLRVSTHATSVSVAGANTLPRTRIDEPPVAPNFDVAPVGNLQVKIRYHFDGAPVRGNSTRNHIRSSQKPIFAQSVQFYYKLTAPVPGRDFYEGMVPMETATRSPFQFTFNAAIGGRQVYIAARYVNPRGQVGPWSPINSVTVPIAGVQIVNVPTAV